MSDVLQKLQCPTCGKPVDQYTIGAHTLVCSACGSHIAVGSGEPQTISKSRIPASPVPIEVGQKALLKDMEMLVMGRVVYLGWDDEDKWRWHEWLLGAVDGRMLWLSLDEKGFTLSQKVRHGIVPFNPSKSRVIKFKDGRSFRVHERYPAKIIGVEGELTWRAKDGDQSMMIDGAAQGRRYSVQFSMNELEIYDGEPLSSADVAYAFRNKAWLKKELSRKGRSKLMGVLAAICILFALIGLVAAIGVNSTGDVTTERQISVSKSQPSAKFTFDLDQSGRPAIVSMALIGGLSENTWFDIDVNVTSPNEVKTELFEKAFWHETGRDDEGFWRDTKYKVSDMFVPTVTGTHELELILSDTLSVDAVTLSVTVKRNHIFPLWFVVYGVVIGILGGIFMYMSWMNSRVKT